VRMLGYERERNVTGIQRFAEFSVTIVFHDVNYYDCIATDHAQRDRVAPVS